MESSTLILLAEDDPLIALNLQDALEDAGFAVHHVLAGSEALTGLEARQQHLSALVTDIRLGDDVDGWAIGRRARELMPHLPVVYISGDSAHEHTVDGVPESIMLQKPFAEVQLVTALATLLNALPPAQPT